MFKVGMEIEFCSYEAHYNIPIGDLGLEREYYSNMIEFNNFLMEGKSKEDLEKIIEKIVECIKELALEIYDNMKNKEALWISEYGFCANDGLVYNGIHLHISVPEMEYKYRNGLFSLDRIRKYIVQYKVENNIDLRFLTSHHIWGHYRGSNYQFKQKRKYQPVIWTSRGTIEIRCLNYFDFTENKDVLVEYLWNIICYLNGESNFRIKRKSKEVFKFLKNIHSEDIDYDYVIGKLKEFEYGDNVKFEYKELDTDNDFVRWGFKYKALVLNYDGEFEVINRILDYWTKCY
jgi:hypothetical protein